MTPQIPAPWLYDALGGWKSSTGISVTEESSLQFSAVYACVRVIADQMASFPKGIYRRVDDRTRERAFDHPLQRLVDSEPNESYSAFDFWDAVTVAVLLWGNGFARITRNRQFELTGLEFISPAKIKVYYGTLNGKNILFYEHKETFERIPCCSSLVLLSSRAQRRGYLTYGKMKRSITG